MPNSLRLESDLPPLELAHDGTPTGCLCAVAEAYRQQTATPVPVRFRRPGNRQDLFADIREIESDPARAGQFLSILARQSSDDTVRILLRALTAMPDHLENALLGYVHGIFMHGTRVAQAHADPDVVFVHRWARRVSLEIHRFKGLLRFQELRSGRLLAVYEPDFDITLPLAFHFRQRLAGESWILLDGKRQQAATWNGRRLNAESAKGALLTGAALERCLEGDGPSGNESRNQRLWQLFHRTVGIANRSNPTLQRQFMPVRYWKYLTEMQAPGPSALTHAKMSPKAPQGEVHDPFPKD